MYSREVSEYYTAKQKAARRIYKGWVKPADLPTTAEIREQVQLLTRLNEGTQDAGQRLLDMRLRAAWWLKKLESFHPKLIGSVLKGCVREGSDIDIHVFASNVHSITLLLDDFGVLARHERPAPGDNPSLGLVEPNAYVNEGYTPGIMPANLVDQMSEEELDALVLWLLDPNRQR